MLSLPTMGVLALGVLWLNTLLIAADAWRRRAALSRRLETLRAARSQGALVLADVTEGKGEGGAFATRRVRQVGRAMTVPGPQRILFTDASSEGAVHGGRARVGDRTVEVGPSPAAELWCMPRDERGGAEAFDQAWPRASTFKGVPTELVCTVGPGDRVWLWIEGEGEQVRVRLVASEDPVEVVTRARRPLLGVASAAVVGATLVTGLALWPPAFGPISTLGGALGLAFFLGIQPLGTAARDRARLPPERHVGGLWHRPG
ncbi:MAG: hypothetical protein OHK0013_11640 [Sandaracinaceae bacterium]